MDIIELSSSRKELDRTFRKMLAAQRRYPTKWFANMAVVGESDGASNYDIWIESYKNEDPTIIDKIYIARNVYGWDLANMPREKWEGFKKVGLPILVKLRSGYRPSKEHLPQEGYIYYGLPVSYYNFSGHLENALAHRPPSKENFFAFYRFGEIISCRILVPILANDTIESLRERCFQIYEIKKKEKPVTFFDRLMKILKRG